MAATGCLAGGARSSPLDERITDTGTPAGTDGTGTAAPGGTDGTGTPTPRSPSATPSPTHEQAADQPDPDHEVRVTNDHDRPHVFEVTVTGPVGERVHGSSHELEPGGEGVPYDLQQANTDGIQPIDVTAAMGDQRESVTIRTNACYGDALVYATGEGELYVTDAIC